MSNYRFDKLRLLVVDDSTHMRKLVAAILRGFGVRDVTEAPNAEHAWAKMVDCNPDVIITDWFLEGMSGIDFARKVRSNESPNPLVPLIMLTGYTHLSRVREARDAGFNEFLAKPVTPKTLMMRLCSVIDKPRAFVRTERYFGPCRRRRPGDGYEGPKRRNDELTAQAQQG